MNFIELCTIYRSMEQKYQSLTSPSVLHDKYNLLVEIYFLNKKGLLEEFPWRKGHSCYNEWPLTLSLLKKLINQHGIDAEHLAWYFSKFRISNIDSKNFGLFAWKVKRIFSRVNLNSLKDIYKIRYNLNKTVEDLEYANKSLPARNKSLLDILKEIERI